MFWGLIMQPGRKYTQIAERSFHLSMASLDIARLDTDDLKVIAWKNKENTQEVCHNKNLVQVICHHNDRSYLMCNLNTTTLCQVPLNMNFKKGERITFSSTGPVNIHLTGYLLGKDFDDYYESPDEQEEKPSKLMKRKAQEKLKNETKLKRTKQLASDFRNGVIDDFKSGEVNLSGNIESDTEDSSSSETEEEVEDEEDSDESDEEDTTECTIENESSDEDEDSEESSEEDKDYEEQSTTSKQQKKKNKKIQEQREPQKLKKKRSAEICEFLKLASAKMQIAQEQKGKQKKKTESPLKLSNGIKDKKDKIREGGVKVHDIEVGHGPQAQVGKTVVMYSTSRLKNGKRIDSQTQGEGLKFKLGKGDVIKGLDIGLVGMKVGGKRRITIPSSMGYGAKGYPPIVPPNSLIIYEVELKKVY